MIETSSGLRRKSSAIFGNFQEMFGNIHLAFETIIYKSKIFSNLQKGVGNLQKIIKNALNQYV